MSPKINGILETALYVSDLDRSLKFYQSLFQFPVLFTDERLCALNAGPGQVLLLFRKGHSVSATETPGGIIPPHNGVGQLHMAYAISADSLDEWLQCLTANNVAIESRVTWPKGGTSLYFRDPDAHLIELATPGIWGNY